MTTTLMAIGVLTTRTLFFGSLAGLSLALGINPYVAKQFTEQ